MQEKLDKLATDVSAPVPDMGLARLLVTIFNVLGIGLILFGAVALFYSLQPVAASAPTPGSAVSLSQILEGPNKTALVWASILGIVGGASYMLIGATVGMIADIRIEMAHSRRLLAAVLETNLRPYNPNMKIAPTPIYYPLTQTLTEPEEAAAVTEPAAEVSAASTAPTSDTGPQPVVTNP
jgi:hypothetical protein